jgi:hypothetical protein
MIRKTARCFILITFGALLRGDIIDTSNPGTFQSGATVVDFESISGRTPQTITAYNPGTPGDPVSPNSFIFDQISGVKFSVGGAPGTNEPALYELSGGIAADAKSPDTVLGPVDFDFTTKFSSNALIEIFFPTKVSKVGFWLNPSLGNVCSSRRTRISRLVASQKTSSSPATAQLATLSVLNGRRPTSAVSRS